MFTLIQIGWMFGGPFLDFCSFERHREIGHMEFEVEHHSLLCINLGFTPFKFYMEIGGIAVLDLYKENDE